MDWKRAIDMRETILVIQCHNNFQKIEYRTVAEKWSSFVVVAIFEIYLVLDFVVTLTTLLLLHFS